MEIEWTAKEWTRVIYLIRKGIKKDPNELDTELLYKALMFAKQAKKDELDFEDLLGD